MKVIKANEMKIIMSSFVGDASIEQTGEKFDLSTTMSLEPIVKFENGDKVIMQWQDIIEYSRKYLKKYNEKNTVPEFKNFVEFRKWLNKNYKNELKKSSNWLQIKDLNFEGASITGLYSLYCQLEDYKFENEICISMIIEYLKKIGVEEDESK